MDPGREDRPAVRPPLPPACPGPRSDRSGRLGPGPAPPGRCASRHSARQGPGPGGAAGRRLSADCPLGLRGGSGRPLPRSGRRACVLPLLFVLLLSTCAFSGSTAAALGIVCKVHVKPRAGSGRLDVCSPDVAVTRAPGGASSRSTPRAGTRPFRGWLKRRSCSGSRGLCPRPCRLTCHRCPQLVWCSPDGARPPGC